MLSIELNVGKKFAGGRHQCTTVISELSYW